MRNRTLHHDGYCFSDSSGQRVLAAGPLCNSTPRYGVLSPSVPLPRLAPHSGFDGDKGSLTSGKAGTHMQRPRNRTAGFAPHEVCQRRSSFLLRGTIEPTSPCLELPAPFPERRYSGVTRRMSEPYNAPHIRCILCAPEDWLGRDLPDTLWCFSGSLSST
jgi:hypothetical protein